MPNSWEVHPAAKPYISAPPRDRKGEARVPERTIPPNDTRRLVEQAQNGDKDAFGELYRQHHGSVYRLARFYLSADGAEDAAAETFLRAWKGLPRYRWTGAPFASWLYGIARNVTFDVLRTRGRTEVREEVPDEPNDPTEDTVRRLDVHEAMQRLPDEQRQVIEMKYLIGMSNAQVAAALGKTPGAVNAQQWRALSNLRKLMENQ